MLIYYGNMAYLICYVLMYRYTYHCSPICTLSNDYIIKISFQRSKIIERNFGGTPTVLKKGQQRTLQCCMHLHSVRFSNYSVQFLTTLGVCIGSYRFETFCVKVKNWVIFLLKTGLKRFSFLFILNSIRNDYITLKYG